MPELRHPWIDHLAEAFFQTTFPDAFSNDELEGYLQACRAFYDAKTEAPMAWVVDATHLRGSDPVKRRILAEHLKSSKAVLDRDCCATAVVTPSRMLRGIMQAVLWFAPPDYPLMAFDNIVDARSWAAQQLSTATGVDVVVRPAKSA